jgi:hypothetical protein
MCPWRHLMLTERALAVAMCSLSALVLFFSFPCIPLLLAILQSSDSQSSHNQLWTRARQTELKTMQER